jgi:hypothetical protein
MATYSSFKKIETESIIDSAITGEKFAPNSVISSKFASASVRTTDIQNGAVGTTQLSSTVDLSGKTVTYRPIVNADINNGAIAGGNLASGAATTNLGYTPLNRAGDTATGQFRLAGGSVGTASLQGPSDPNTGIYFPTTNQVSLSTNGGQRLLINADGHNIEPTRPAFYAAGNGGWYYANSFGGVNSWRELTGFTWNVIQQGGNNFNSNGRFTAPVSGYYYFYLQSYYYNDNNGAPNYTHWNIGRNGSPGTAVGGRTPHTMFSHGVPNNYTPGIQTTIEFWMDAGNYASPQPYWGSGGGGRIHGDHSLWCGYLIG